MLSSTLTCVFFATSREYLPHSSYIIQCSTESASAAQREDQVHAGDGLSGARGARGAQGRWGRGYGLRRDSELRLRQCDVDGLSQWQRGLSLRVSHANLLWLWCGCLHVIASCPKVCVVFYALAIPTQPLNFKNAASVLDQRRE